MGAAMEEEPKAYQAIMVSSTFTDLAAHRREVIDAIHRFRFHPSVMEYSGARSDADVIEASLRMVRDAVAYVCVIGHKYGQTPADAARNPRRLSITELEFDEALRLGRPILLFLMADDHVVLPKDVEPHAKKRAKLDAFRKRAKRADPASEVDRVYDVFSSKEEFAKKAAIAIGLLAVQAAGTQTIPDRAVREAVARFIDVEPGASQAALTAEIERFEAGYRALQAQVEAIVLVDNRVAALKADAEQALVEGDLDKARAAWRAAADAACERAAEPARNAALLKAAEADAHLLGLDWQAADTAWTEAAAMLAPFDREGAEEIAEEASERLTRHGERFARAGALGAAIVRRRSLADALNARGDQKGTARLRNNLGIALHVLGERTGGAEGLRLIDDAVAAFREALTVRTRADLPAKWAMTQNNLGIALRSQGGRTGGAVGLRLIEEAVAANREALTVYTHADVPADWAMTQNNLGNALHIQGRLTGGADGMRLLDDALAAHRKALTIYTRADMPANWAMTRENIGLLHESMADLEPAKDRVHLGNAEAALADALTVYTPEHMPYYHEKATRALERVRARLAPLDR
jgi:tetratricopeptide (TPR) repeat protein